MKISIIPFRNFNLENQLFKGSEQSIQNELEPYFYLKEYLKSHNIHINTYDITSIKDAELVIFFDLKISALIKVSFTENWGNLYIFNLNHQLLNH